MYSIVTWPARSFAPSIDAGGFGADSGATKPRASGSQLAFHGRLTLSPDLQSGQDCRHLPAICRQEPSGGPPPRFRVPSSSCPAKRALVASKVHERTEIARMRSRTNLCRSFLLLPFCESRDCTRGAIQIYNDVSARPVNTCC